MSWSLDIPRVMRRALLWLPMVCAVFALGWSAEAAHGSDACCAVSHADEHAPQGAEQAAHDHSGHDHAGHDHAGHGHAGHDCPSEDCPSDGCPGDCANCSCCAALATALPSLGIPVAAITFVPLALVTPADAPASGVATSVFRPPRA